MCVAAERSVFRSLLRLCRQMDRTPVQLVTLTGCKHGNKVEPGKQGHAVRPFLEDALWLARGGSSEYAHPTDGTAAAAVRRHRRRAVALGLEYSAEAQTLLHKLENARKAAMAVFDCKSISGHHAVQDRIKPTDSKSSRRCTRSPYRRVPAHSAEPVAVGDLLLAHPLACLSRPFLDQALVLVVAVDTATSRVVGIALNKRSPLTLADMLAAWPQHTNDLLMAELLGLGPLLGMPIRKGGLLKDKSGSLLKSTRWLHVLGERAVPGATEVAPGVWLDGDVTSLATAINDGKAKCGEHVQPFYGHLAWTPAELASELQRGVWARARFDSNAVTPRDLCFGGSQSIPAQTVWRHALVRMGLPALADFPRDSINGVDAMLLDMFAKPEQRAVSERQT